MLCVCHMCMCVCGVLVSPNSEDKADMRFWGPQGKPNDFAMPTCVHVCYDR